MPEAQCIVSSVCNSRNMVDEEVTLDLESMGLTDDALIHSLAVALSVEGLSKRVGHKKISTADIANDVNLHFKEVGLERSVDAS